jgi:PAS domain S-box-containing protein
VLESEFPARTVSLVESYEECLREVETGNVDAVVTEYDLGARTGVELIATIRNRDANLPVVLFTAQVDEEVVGSVAEISNATLVQRTTDASVHLLAQTLEERFLSAVPSDTDERPEADSQFDAVVTTASDAIVTIDTNSIVRFANPAVEAIFGYEPEELVGESLTVLMGDGLADRHLAAFERYLETEERSLDWDAVELSAVHKDGHEVPIEVSFAEFSRRGTRFFTGIIRDTTSRKRRERERKRYETLMDTVGDGIYALDEEARFIAVNSAYTALTGYDRDELLGEPATKVTGTALADELVDVQAAFEDGTDVATIETSLPTRSGDTIPIEARITPLEQGDGSVGRVGVVRDISERKQLQRDLREQRNLNRQIINTTPVGIIVVDEHGEIIYCNERTEEIIGVPRRRLADDDVEFAVTDAQGEELRYEDRPFAKVIEEGHPVYDYELGVVRPDGDRVWVSVNGSRLDSAARDTTLGVFTLQDVTAAREQAQKLEALDANVQQLPDAETTTDVCEITIDTAADVLDFPYAYILLYHEEDGELQLAAQTAGVSEIVESPLLGALEESPVWNAFIRDTSTTVSEVDASADGPGIESASIFPLGEHGVFVTVSPERDAFEQTDILLAEILCANTRSSLDRAARETELRSQRDTLERKNKRLERVNRINHAIRDITQVLIQADTQEEIQELVCEKLAAIDPFSFAWIGKYNQTTNEVTPVSTAGRSSGFLDQVTNEDGEMTPMRGPAGRASEMKQSQVQNNILRATEFEPWREVALTQGFRASVSVPLQHRDTLYGVLSLYSQKPSVFEEMETTVLEELGQSIGYAMSAIERKRALVSESSIQLQFRISRIESPLLGFIDGGHGSFALENVVQRLDGDVHVFFTARGVDPAVAREHAEQSPAVKRFSLISEDENECLCECSIRDSTFIATVLDRGAVLDSMTVEDGSAAMTLRVPQSTDVRSFVGFFEERFGDVELTARRESDEPVMTQHEFENEVREQLTARQQEVIKTAYVSGFFEWPRNSTGQDVAELLGVTQPTVNRHIRAGERTLFGLLFDD